MPFQYSEKVVLLVLTFLTFYYYFNPFVPNAPFIYFLKTSEKKKGALGTNGLKDLYEVIDGH